MKKNINFIRNSDLELIFHEYTPGKLVEFIQATKIIVLEKNSQEAFRKEVGPGIVCMLLSTKSKPGFVGFDGVEFELLHNEEIFLYYTTINPFMLLKLNPNK